MNKLEEYRDLFSGIAPWAGMSPKGCRADFLGAFTDIAFDLRYTENPPEIGGRYVETRLPQLDNTKPPGTPLDVANLRGEGWFEAANWVIAAREARERFVMITLGACYGAQAVGSYLALQKLNPMPCKLVAVEPVPENMELLRRHFRNNGIDSDVHWLVPTAVSSGCDPAFFAMTPWSMGSQNCFSTNERSAREDYYRRVISSGKVAEALSDLLLRNSTGIEVSGRSADGAPLKGEIKYVSALTLAELLGPFTMVDYLESDIQQSEIIAFPPFMTLLKKKVRRIHIGTHGKETHDLLHELFVREGWRVVFSYEPEGRFDTPLGSFKTGDGILTVRNPVL